MENKYVTIPEPIPYGKIKISTFGLLYIKNMVITADINEHTELNLTGVLSDDKKDEYIYKNINKPIKVYYEINNQMQTIYIGIVTELKLVKINNCYEINIKAKSYTYILDIKRRKRSFQDKLRMLYDLIQEITKSCGNGNSYMNIPNEQLGRLWVQYDETDWQFIKRIASYYNAGIYPYSILDGINYYVGTPNMAAKNIAINEYTATKLFDKYERIKQNEIPTLNETDFIVYKIESYEILSLGDCINFNGQSLYISKLKYEIVDGILKNTYLLQTKSGQQIERIYNEKLQGISLEGSVIEVIKDEIKVKLDIDKIQEKEKARLFKYSTIAASPDGSGWYFMPELKDRVRIYFPNNDEENAFAKSCIEQIKGDPDTKYIANIHGQKVVFTPSSITISASNNATIVLNKNGSISIAGANISVNASDSISMRAENNVLLSGKNNVDITCDKGGKVILDGGGNVILKGTKVKIN